EPSQGFSKAQPAPGHRNGLSMPIVFLLSATKMATGSLGSALAAAPLQSAASPVLLMPLACRPAPRALKKRGLLQIYEDYREGKTIDQPHYGNRPVNFDFLGVWDSVGALAFGRTIGDFHRINPGNVLRIAHALALDEERERFEPSYWDKPASANTQVDEVWFSGCHTNIGGGYCDTNLSNIALIWVL